MGNDVTKSDGVTANLLQIVRIPPIGCEPLAILINWVERDCTG